MSTTMAGWRQLCWPLFCNVQLGLCHRCSPPFDGRLFPITLGFYFQDRGEVYPAIDGSNGHHAVLEDLVSGAERLV